MARMTLTLTDDERRALIELAKQEKRYPRDQELCSYGALEDAGFLAPIMELARQNSPEVKG